MEETPSSSLFPDPLSEAVYRDLAIQATETTSVFSSVGRIMKEPSVQKIIKLGVDVLPLVFNDLQNGNFGCQWRMEVVREILESHGLPPVEIPDELIGGTEERIKIHIEYGYNHGLI